MLFVGPKGMGKMPSAIALGALVYGEALDTIFQINMRGLDFIDRFKLEKIFSKVMNPHVVMHEWFSNVLIAFRGITKVGDPHRHRQSPSSLHSNCRNGSHREAMVLQKFYLHMHNDHIQ